ncbi:3127_t:CDS:2 [Paraglomus occultum]|uniref:Protein N-terminal glutamine amidohydrolase n=1 Tax=Paraglomus occultum TaxID=144539 RepID=A0A9N8WCC6_9GLOM|nr:3127_t:CDS:2 [Paraglomus occultum]
MPPYFKSEHKYTPNYCEENVYHLCHKFLALSGSQLEEDDANGEITSPASEVYVVFITNEWSSIPLLRQRAGAGLNAEGFVCWDYHVILLYTEAENGQKKRSWVYDLDTVLPFPCEFETYRRSALARFPQRELQRKYRLIPAKTYLEVFASDRSHMLQEDGSWKAPPPAYPPISTDGKNVNAGI